jgi:hypothetical protein
MNGIKPTEGHAPSATSLVLHDVLRARGRLTL